MHFTSALTGLAVVAASAVEAASKGANSGIRGFNTGASFLNNQPKQKVDFVSEFNRAKQLPEITGFNTFRLYTTVQANAKTPIPISAIDAAIETKTKLLLGMWISGSPSAIDNEIAALKTAVRQHGNAFASLVVGISVGSEDLYRHMTNGNGVGASAKYLNQCIQKVRNALKEAPFKGTSLANTPVGHVDTYDAFLNGTNSGVVENLDFVGFDGYPYWESKNANSINDAKKLFDSGLQKMKTFAKGKNVWVTETGWPTVGKTQHLAVANKQNARKYWKDVACSLMAANVNVFWYTLQESQWGDATTDFGVYGPGNLATLKPKFSLSCTSP